jgi:hypothetical protein
MNEYVLTPRRRLPRGGRHLARNGPDKPCELARNCGGDFRVGLPARDEAPEARGLPELRLPAMSHTNFGRGFLPIGMLTPNPGNALIRPR